MASLELGTANPASAKGKGDCVLLIEAEPDDAVRILGELDSATDEPFYVQWVTNLSAGIERLRTGEVGAVVLDLTLPDSQGVATFDKLSQAVPGVPILILSGADTEAIARQAVQRGAQDYVIKNHAGGYRLRQAVRTMMDRRTADATLLEHQVADLTLDSIGEAVLRSDLDGNVVYLNRMAEKMTGWRREEALGSPAADVLRMIDGVSGAAVRDILKIAMREDSSINHTVKYMHCNLFRRDGSELGIEHTATLTRNLVGGVTGALVAFHDVSAAQARSLEVSHSAQHDPLTDLPNRILFRDRLTQAIALAERQGRQLAVLFVDIDHFKKINDSLGHAVGDQLLQSVATRLLTCVRRTDTVSRLGGDEFVVLLSEVEREDDAALSAQKILRSLSAPHTIENKDLDINVSIGVSTYPTNGADADSLLNRADTAMYEAKRHGRHSYQFFRKDMQVRLADRQLLEGDLRYALGRNEFLLHYQPKFNLQSGQVTGVEALIRWAHPQRGIVPPAQFIPIVEECGLILPIGRWVLLEACKQSRAWSDSGLGDVSVAVNVSASEFRNKDFLSEVRAVLISTGVDPPNLEIELTESVLMHDAESTVDTLHALKAMGVQLAIDDFGTGYSSFTYLRRFPADALKVDQSFVREITSDPEDATIVSAMINIGKSLNLRVVAEGVETRAQLEFLQRNGCGEGQGYYFGRPASAEQASELLQVGVRGFVAEPLGEPL